MEWGPGPPVGAEQGRHPVCVWARAPGASGLPLHAGALLHLTPLNLDRLASPLPLPTSRPGQVPQAQVLGAAGFTRARMTDPDSSRGAGGLGGGSRTPSAFRSHASLMGIFLEPAALTLAWASGWTLSVAMAGEGA